MVKQRTLNFKNQAKKLKETRHKRQKDESTRIDNVKSRIFNIKSDLKKFPDNYLIANKLKRLEEELEMLEDDN